MDNKIAATSFNTQAISASAPSQSPSEQEIAARAYEIFLDRGATDGNDLEDWLQAERELSARIASTTKARSASA